MLHCLSSYDKVNCDFVKLKIAVLFGRIQRFHILWAGTAWIHMAVMTTHVILDTFRVRRAGTSDGEFLSGVRIFPEPTKSTESIDTHSFGFVEGQIIIETVAFPFITNKTGVMVTFIFAFICGAVHSERKFTGAFGCGRITFVAIALTGRFFFARYSADCIVHTDGLAAVTRRAGQIHAFMTPRVKLLIKRWRALTFPCSANQFSLSRSGIQAGVTRPMSTATLTVRRLTEAWTIVHVARITAAFELGLWG